MMALVHVREVAVEKVGGSSTFGLHHGDNCIDKVGDGLGIRVEGWEASE